RGAMGCQRGGTGQARHGAQTAARPARASARCPTTGHGTRNTDRRTADISAGQANRHQREDGMNQASEGAPTEGGQRATRPVRVRLADDQPRLRAGFRMVLGADPTLDIVGEAGDGVEAVELARRLLPDVVVMDVRMPRLDGVAATRAIVEARLPVRVLILTTVDLDEYVIGALRAGASGFLVKDVAADELLAA